MVNHQQLLFKQLKQIDSVFIYSPSSDAVADITETQHSYLVNWCENKSVLKDRIGKSHEELDKHIATSKIYNKKEKAIRNLSKEAGSFLYFQLFKNILKHLPKTIEAKKAMITICRNYYRENLAELANIDDFDKTYKSVDAILWYTKDTFVNKFINKALRTEDIDVLFQFRFYIIDLSEQLELKFQELKEKQKDILKLYRAIQLSQDELTNYQNSIGNLISNNEYLSTSSQRSVAYDFLTKFTKQEGIVHALVEYSVNLNVVQKITIADVRQYSAFPEETEFVVDIEGLFQIDSYEYNAVKDLWYIKVHATDQGDDLIAEYFEYQNEKMTKSNIIVFFGNLLIEMSEYDKAQRYFDTILSSSYPNDEEIACIFYNFGRIYRFLGNFYRAYQLHMNARLNRIASAGKTLNGLGLVYIEQGNEIKAEECFKRAMHLYKKSIPRKHIEVTGTVINLGNLDCSRQNFEQAKEIYDNSLPLLYPNRVLLRVNLGNIHLTAGNYQMALEEYEAVIKLQETSLPSNHPDIARTLHNLAIVHAHQGNKNESKNI
ncbi:unnamed protein product [Rotaria sordida]|uniref:Uncharacterized protein n=1 Tax=Rotaria sordida TaxID=392033 RepID=A0A815R489_9BILA|nr:unnamed protein product [Rotaria sordida]CAF1472236.1 unnamed protein product [Rotaria sordida]